MWSTQGGSTSRYNRLDGAGALQKRVEAIYGRYDAAMRPLLSLTRSGAALLLYFLSFTAILHLLPICHE